MIVFVAHTDLLPQLRILKSYIYNRRTAIYSRLVEAFHPSFTEYYPMYQNISLFAQKPLVCLLAVVDTTRMVMLCMFR